MEQVVVELFSKESNGAIVRLPGRAFPGVVIQGDSLSILCASANALVDTLAALERNGTLGVAEALDHARGLLDALQQRLDAYEKCLGDHGLALPYVKSPHP